jgi:SAM-dependent methyltransferase
MSDLDARLTTSADTMLLQEYTRMAGLESRLWWYRSLHADLLDLITEVFASQHEIRIVDAGCGTGGLLVFLREHGYLNCIGLDSSALAIDFCRNRALTVLQGSITDNSMLEQAGKADVIISMDVICSLADDQLRISFINNSYRQLREGGLLIIQTPAFPCLAGIHDLAVGVKKRFTARSMRDLLNQTDVKDYVLRYRLVLLTPVVLIMRTLQRLQLLFNSTSRIESDVKLPVNLINSMLFGLQRLEDRFLSMRPFGTSLQILVRKQASDNDNSA